MGNGENTELLDLKMKTTESSYPYKRTLFMPPSSHPHFFTPSGKETSDDGVGGGGSGPGNFVGNDIYDVVVSSAAALPSRPLQQPFNTGASMVFKTLCSTTFTLFPLVFLFFLG